MMQDDNWQSVTQPVLFSIAGRIATIALNRPHVHNAIDIDTAAALGDALDWCDAAPEVRAIVLTGHGASFCAGDDLRSAAALDAEGFERSIALLQQLTRQIVMLGKPVIAALNGPAYGAGLELSLACDMRVATPAFTCATPEVMWGLVVTNGASLLLPRLIGWAKAREMLLSGARVDAEWCLAAGLIDEIAEADALSERAVTLAQALSRGAPGATRATRAMLHDTFRRELEAALASETRTCVAAFASDEARKGLGAFLEKREPDWSGK